MGQIFNNKKNAINNAISTMKVRQSPAQPKKRRSCQVSEVGG